MAVNCIYVLVPILAAGLPVAAAQIMAAVRHIHAEDFFPRPTLSDAGLTLSSCPVGTSRYPGVALADVPADGLAEIMLESELFRRVTSAPSDNSREFAIDVHVL